MSLCWVLLSWMSLCWVSRSLFMIRFKFTSKIITEVPKCRESSVTRLSTILPFGFFLLGHFFIPSKKKCQNKVFSTYFNIQMQFGVTILDFQFQLWYFGYISKLWVNLFSNFWSLYKRDRIVTELWLLLVGWYASHVGSLSLLPQMIIFTQLACPLNEVIFY